MFQDDKFPGSGNPYNLFEYFQNKAFDSNKTLQKRWYTNGSIREQQFLNTGSNKSYFSHWKKERRHQYVNAGVLWVFVLLNASNFVMETEDNSIQRQVYDSSII